MAVEVRGVEPRSEVKTLRTSTRVVRSENFDPSQPTGLAVSEPIAVLSSPYYPAPDNPASLTLATLSTTPSGGN